MWSCIALCGCAVAVAVHFIACTYELTWRENMSREELIGRICVVLFSRIPVRPSEEQLAVMRRARMKERKMFFLIQEITVHLMFMIVIALVTYGHKDNRAVFLYRQIDSLSTMTNEVSRRIDKLHAQRLELSLRHPLPPVCEVVLTSFFL